MYVKKIMTRGVISVSPQAPISQVAELLFDKNLTGMPVVDRQNKVIGIVTEYDLMSRQEHLHLPTYLDLLKKLDVQKNHQPLQSIDRIQRLAVKDIMTSPVITISPNTSVEKAAGIFTSQHINPLPVVADGVLVGIISRADIVKLFKKTDKS